jgi:phosphoserine phosphatase
MADKRLTLSQAELEEAERAYQRLVRHLGFLTQWHEKGDWRRVAMQSASIKFWATELVRVVGPHLKEKDRWLLELGKE